MRWWRVRYRVPLSGFPRRCRLTFLNFNSFESFALSAILGELPGGCERSLSKSADFGQVGVAVWLYPAVSAGVFFTLDTT